MGIPKLWAPDQSMVIPKLTFTELHLHTEYSLKDGQIRVADHDDPKHVKKDIILHAEKRGTGAVTATDHGNMYGHAILASVAKNFGLKHIPACEFYIAPGSRHEKSTQKGGEVYRHICGWAKNKEGYANLCRLQDLAYSEGFYYQPRIDKELVGRYGDHIMWSDACLGGTIGSLLTQGKDEEAKAEFMWYMDRFGDDFYIEYQDHGMGVEHEANLIKVDWANAFGVPIIATSDAHYYRKEDWEAHKTLLCIQYQNWLDNPMFDGFSGDGYWLMDDLELLQRFPVEYLNNTQLIVDKVEPNIIEFGEVTPPQFKVPDWFMEGSK